MELKKFSWIDLEKAMAVTMEKKTEISAKRNQ